MKIECKIVGCTNVLISKKGQEYRMLYVCRDMDGSRGFGMVAESFYIDSHAEFFSSLGKNVVGKNATLVVHYYNGQNFLVDVDLN